MCSLTQSSADTSFSIPVNPPATLSNTLHTPTHIPHPSHPTRHVTQNPSQPRPFTPSTPQCSFFDIEDTSSLLSPHSKHCVMNTIRNGWAKSTVKRYSSSIKEYICFCNMEGIPEHLRFPANEFILCAFAASSAGISTPAALHEINCQPLRLGTLHIISPGTEALIYATL